METTCVGPVGICLYLPAAAAKKEQSQREGILSRAIPSPKKLDRYTVKQKKKKVLTLHGCDRPDGPVLSV